MVYYILFIKKITNLWHGQRTANILLLQYETVFHNN